MKITLSYVAARIRETGEIVLLVSVESMVGGADVSPIARLVGEFCGGTPEGAELRAKYSHVLGIVENQERHVLEFPDPAIAERDRKAIELAAAKQEAANKAALEKAAKDNAANLKTLAAERKQADTRVEELTEELESIEILPAKPILPPPSPIALPKPASEVPEVPPVDSPAEALAKLSDEQLLEVARQTGVEVGEPLDRAALITAILAAAPPAA